MEKKNPNRFTIGFNKDSPSHQKAVDILNQVSDKAEFIAAAVLHYTGEQEGDAVSAMDMESLQPLLRKLIQQEVRKAIGEIGGSQEPKEPEIIDLTAEESVCMDSEMAENLFSAMNAFRR